MKPNSICLWHVIICVGLLVLLGCDVNGPTGEQTKAVPTMSPSGDSAPSGVGESLSAGLTPAAAQEADAEGKNEKPAKPVPEDMVFIPAGEFLMGSPAGVGAENERPQHPVYVNAFCIDKYEVTNAQFKEFVDATGYVTDAEKQGYGDFLDGVLWRRVPGSSWRHPYAPTSTIDHIMSSPVVQVSWNDAVAYARWAGKRLPTEAEWEKAARGTDGREYPWGNDNPRDGGRYRTNYNPSRLDEDGHRFAAPVGSFESGKSPHGVYDMAGNVSEWCADWYANDYYQQSTSRNPRGPATGQRRVLRGGTWADKADAIRAAFRDSATPESRYYYIGFRCAQDCK